MDKSFDVHEYAKRMFDGLDADELRKQISEGTPTGRFPSRPPLPYNLPPTYLREAMAILENTPETERGLYMAMDFAALECRTVALLVGVCGGKMHIIEQLSMEQMYQGKKLDLCIIDDYALIPEPEARFKGEPTKQNGRSAAYLKHDTTKKHKRKR